MSLEVEIKIDEVAEKIQESFEKQVERLDKIDEIEPLFRSVMNYDLKKRFESSPPTASGGIVYGQQYWRQLSDAYLLAKPERANGTIHKDSMALMQSLTEPQHPEQVSSITPEGYYEYGTEIPYADKLQKQLKRPLVFTHETLNIQLSNMVSLYLLSSKDVDEIELELTDIRIEGMGFATAKNNEMLEQILKDEKK